MSEPVGNTPRSNIPGNSHRARENELPSEPREEREKIEKVIEGTVIRRKIPWWRRAGQSIIADDAHNVSDYVLVDVIVPAVRNLLYDIVTQSAGRVLYSGGRSSTRRLRDSGSGSSLRTQYNRVNEEPRSLSRESRARHDFDDIVIPTRSDAVDVLDRMYELLERYRQVSVSDLYDIVGISGSPPDLRWGWTNLDRAEVRQTRGGFLLDLPRTEQLR